jgi:hypothetical protein
MPLAANKFDNMAKKYRGTLSEEERSGLEEMTFHRRKAGQPVHSKHNPTLDLPEGRWEGSFY